MNISFISIKAQIIRIPPGSVTILITTYVKKYPNYFVIFIAETRIHYWMNYKKYRLSFEMRENITIVEKGNITNNKTRWINAAKTWCFIEQEEIYIKITDYFLAIYLRFTKLNPANLVWVCLRKKKRKNNDSDFSDPALKVINFFATLQIPYHQNRADTFD